MTCFLQQEASAFTVHGSIPISRPVEQVIDLSDFQRLRGVRQLGPAYFVFPGANHTRFEHSLGVYSLSLRYLERLVASDAFYGFVHQSGRQIVTATVAAALLHDIGHYPFSHLIEEIDELGEMKLSNHEERARGILESAPLCDVLRKEWKVSPSLVASIIAKGRLEGGFALAQSIIDSDLDCDKLDYLLRDSLHCGVTYGYGIDVERFLSSLHIDSDNETICLNSRGKTHLLALLGARNIMYQDVYWHKTVRACGAMFKALLFGIVDAGHISRHELHLFNCLRPNPKHCATRCWRS